EPVAWRTPKVKSGLADIPSGYTTLGLVREHADDFGWDNELGSETVAVGAFALERCNVTNGDFLRFVQAGGYQARRWWSAEAWAWKEREGVECPAFWRQAGNLWMYRTMFGEARLPLDWPVYVSHAEATAYAGWLGRKLPTEAQYHRAAFGTPGSRRE